MEAISWAYKPTIQSVHPQEPQVLALRESIASKLTAALYPARQYIAKVQTYCSWLEVDPVAYVEALQVSPWRRESCSFLFNIEWWIGNSIQNHMEGALMIAACAGKE